MSSNVAPISGTPFDADGFRRACARFATGITIVTVLDDTGAPRGMTVNSFTSVSLHPPMVLVCIDNRAALLPVLIKANRFGINILSEHQQNLSMKFARSGEDAFGAIEWFPGDFGVPLLPGVLAAYECSIARTIEAGDHRIVLGHVQHLRCHEGRPLLYHNSGYGRVSHE